MNLKNHRRLFSGLFRAAVARTSQPKQNKAGSSGAATLDSAVAQQIEVLASPNCDLLERLRLHSSAVGAVNLLSL